MMKETFYFQHDYNARNDPKLQEVLIEHGVAGIGVFWCVIEQIYEQGGKLPLKSCKSIAFALHVDCKVVESVVNDFDLFQNDGAFFWSDSVKRRLDKRIDIAEKRKAAAVKRWQSIQVQQEQTNCNANAMQNDAKERKEKEIKEDLFKEKEISKEKEMRSGAETSSAPPPQKIEKRFTPPGVEEVRQYCEERNNGISPESFIDFYTSKNWMIGKNKMKDWKAAVRTWERRREEENKNRRNHETQRERRIQNVPPEGTVYKTTLDS